MMIIPMTILGMTKHSKNGGFRLLNLMMTLLFLVYVVPMYRWNLIMILLFLMSNPIITMYDRYCDDDHHDYVPGPYISLIMFV